MRLLVVCVLSIAAFAGAEEDFSFSDYIQVTKNGNEITTGRSDDSFETTVEEYMKSHDVTLNLPVIGSTLSFTGRNLDQDEVDVKFKFNTGSQVEARKKSKLKKIFVPIFIFILIKAMVMIPLALGILAIKTWNALQLSFVSFVVALALGVWQLCKKISGDNAHPQIVAAHSPWEAPVARALGEEAQKMAYAAYAPL
ncbi:uncharacterized protein LOC657675 [Tribolium castaneum]|uniref:Osiris 19 n=1 Tax=Tribolium castaneum TaxID=7070 RepID=D6X0W9_TRICA|nr:PREDICTED: uncharacterized protein LOC657675 [Tribolium castaneum]EFA10566.1 hypothetical protein TcasGA2_TC012822 [Tribolium castaneum]|eukprot:XP_969215.1 PREDICTED: uncharacterized protein LOC657675 [Tribolium castaneum]